MPINPSALVRVGLLVGCVPVLLFCLTLSAQAQQTPQVSERVQDRILALGYTHKLDEQTVADLLASLNRAAGQNLPLHPLLEKIEEGLSKKVAPVRILAALDRMIIRLQRLDAILTQCAHISPRQAPRDREHVLMRMNSLTAMGVAPEEIEARLAGPAVPAMGQVLNALETKAALSQAGISAQDAEDIVDAGLTSGFFAGPGWDMARVVRAARDQGALPDQVGRAARDVAAGRTDLRSAAREMGVDFDRAVGRQGRSGSMRGRQGTGRLDAAPGKDGFGGKHSGNGRGNAAGGGQGAGSGGGQGGGSGGGGGGNGGGNGGGGGGNR